MKTLLVDTGYYRVELVSGLYVLHIVFQEYTYTNMDDVMKKVERILPLYQNVGI